MAQSDVFEQAVKEVDYDPEEAGTLMWSGKMRYAFAKHVGKVLFDDPIVANQDYRTDFDRAEAHKYALMKNRRIYDLSVQKKLPLTD